MNNHLRTNGSLLRQALPLIVMAPFAAGGLAHAGVSRQALAETALLAPVLGLICALPPVSEVLRRGSTAHSIILGVFLGAAIFAQIGRTSTASFPFVSWRMFVGVDSLQVAHHLEIEGIRGDGTRVRVSGEFLFPTLRHHRFYMMISAWKSRADKSEEGDEIYQKILAAVRDAHNRANPDDPIERVEVTAVQQQISSLSEPAP